MSKNTLPRVGTDYPSFNEAEKMGAMMVRVYSGFDKTALLVLALAFAMPAKAQEVVFLIRHAERDWSSRDSGLVEAGRARSEAWGDVLSSAYIDVVITSEMARTRETGQPIADALGVPVIVVPRSDDDALHVLLRTEYAEDRVLIVGHSGTIPAIIQRLGHPILFHISDTDYNDLFVVTPKPDGPAAAVRLNIN